MTAQDGGAGRRERALATLRCPRCAAALQEEAGALACRGCAARYPIERGIVDFRQAGASAPRSGLAVTPQAIAALSAETWVDAIRDLLAGRDDMTERLEELTAAGRRLELAFTQGAALGLRVTGPGEDTHILLNGAAEPDELCWGNLRFQGRLLYLRRQRDGRLRVRALGLRRLAAPELGLELKARAAVDFELLLADGLQSWPRGPCAALEVMSHGAGSPSP